MKTNAQTTEFNKVPEYDGYTNRPTWILSLWIINDQNWQADIIQTAKELNKYEMASWLKRCFEEIHYPLVEASSYMDLLNWALDCVNWDELAEHFINDAKEIS